MSKKYKIKYTHLINEWDDEVTDEIIIETKDIEWTLEQFGRNRRIVNYDVKEIKTVQLCLKTAQSKTLNRRSLG